MNFKTYRVIVLAGLFLMCNAFIPSNPAIQNLHGDGLITLHNLHLDEVLAIHYKNPDGSYNFMAVDEINQVLRCRMTQEVHPMSLELIALVDQIQDHFGGKQIEVISGYRSPEFNKQLFNTGHKVAKQSQHMQGHAMDIRIEGVPTKELREYAVSLNVGGVGFYPHDEFVHVDVGRVRYW